MRTVKYSKNFTPSECLLVLALGLYLSTMIFSLSMPAHDGLIPEKILQGIRYLSYFLCVLKLLYGNYQSRKSLIAWILMSAIILIGMFYSGENVLLIFLLFFLAVISGIRSELVISCAFWVMTIGLLVIVGLSQLGVIEDVIVFIDGRYRHFMGFTWTSTGPAFLLFVLLCFLFLKKGRMRIPAFLIVLALDVFFYYRTRTRFAFLVCIIVLVFFLLFGKTMERGRVVRHLKWLFVLMPEILAGLAIALQALYSPDRSVLVRLDQLLSNRLRLGHDALGEYGIRILGNKITWVGFSVDQLSADGYNYVDSSYLNILLQHGVLIFGLILLIYSVLMLLSIHNEKYYLTWILTLMLLFCMTEPKLFNLMYNPFPLLVFTEFTEYRQNEGRKFPGISRIRLQW